MSFFAMLESDALDKKFSNNARRITQSGMGPPDPNDPFNGTKSIRRPYRGIQIKDDTYATLSIIDGNGNSLPLISESAVGAIGASQGLVSDYADFIIQKIEDQRVEKQTIVETFGDSFIFFFGERPRVVTFSGVLVNTEDFNWRSQFWYNYDRYLRGSKLVERNARAFLNYDSIVVEGYPINASASEDSMEPHLVPFQMTLFVTNYYDTSRIGRTSFPMTQDILGLDAANAKLHDQRDGFISTTASVRNANLQAGVATGLFASIRDVGRGINSILSLVSGGLQTLETVLYGRVVRVPLGVSGYLAQVGERALGVQSLSGNPFDIPQGPVTLTGSAKFAPVNPDTVRTQIWMNFDEYPLQNQPEFANIPLSQMLARTEDIASRQTFLAARATELAAINLAASGGSDALTAIADVVSFAKKGFALFNNIKATITDPGAVLLDSLGLSGVGFGQPSTAQGSAAIQALLAAKGLSATGTENLTSNPYTRPPVPLNSAEAVAARHGISIIVGIITSPSRPQEISSEEANALRNILPQFSGRPVALTDAELAASRNIVDAFNTRPDALSEDEANALRKIVAVFSTRPDALTEAQALALRKIAAKFSQRPVALTTISKTGLVNSSFGKQVAGRAISPPKLPTIPNPSITHKPNVK